MIVTINTDASFNPKHQLGSYAMWVACNSGRFKHAGVFKKKIRNSTEAEVLAIINALTIVNKSTNMIDLHKIIVNSDSETFLKYIANRVHLQRVYSKLIHDIFTKYKLKKGWFEFRHVKAHKDTDSKRTYVNDWLDKKAKEVLKQYINDNSLQLCQPGMAL